MPNIANENSAMYKTIIGILVTIIIFMASYILISIKDDISDIKVSIISLETKIDNHIKEK